MHISVSNRGLLGGVSAKSDCTRTVHERVVFSLLGLAFERKQIPRFVGNVVSQELKKELLESSSVRPRQVSSFGDACFNFKLPHWHSVDIAWAQCQKLA